jgi:flagellar biosynthesis/type III secretory pathway chaperone
MNTAHENHTASCETTLDQIDRLIDDEREAIRSIDVDRLDEFAARKLTLMGQLSDRGLTERPDLAARFRETINQLRNNGVLLAHARNCVRDVIQIVAAPASLYDPSGKAAAAPTTVGGLSVTG